MKQKALLFFWIIFGFIGIWGQAPTMSCPGDTTLATQPNVCFAVVNYTTPVCTSNCAGTSITQIDNSGLSSGDNFPIGSTDQIFVISGPGGSDTCRFKVLVWDNQSPTIVNCTNDTIVNTDAGLCSATLTYPLPSGVDNCNAILVQIDNSGIANGGVFPPGVTLQQYILVDDYGNRSDTCSFYVTVIDNEAPSISCPIDPVQYADVNCDIVLADYTGSAIILENCGPIVVSQSPVAGTVLNGNDFPFVISLTATDTSGNASTCNFNLYIEDTIPPAISCPGDQYVSSTGNCQAVLGNYTAQAIVSDGCDNIVTVIQNPVSGTIINTVQVVTLTAIDDDGNSSQCTFKVVVDDNIPPTIICPADTTVAVNSNCNYVLPDFTTLAQVNDNCDTSPEVTQSPLPGTTISGANQFISLTVRDEAGNNSVCSFLLTLEDTLGPNLTCPGNQTMYANSSCQITLPNYTGMTSGSDNCGGMVFLDQYPLNGSIINGNNSPLTVTMTGTDIIGNTNTCSFTVVILDTINPIISSCQGDTNIALNNNCQYVITDFTGRIAATDNCTGQLIYAQNPPVGDTMFFGDVKLFSLFVTDSSGNSDSCHFTVTVYDAIAPTVICPNNPMVPADTSCNYTLPSYDTIITYFDNCAGVVSFVQTPAPGTLLSGIGSSQNVSIFVQDSSGNTNSCSFIVTVVDTLTPTIACPGNQVLDINSSCMYTLPDLGAMSTTFDYCDNNLTTWQTPISGAQMNGINDVIVYVSDASGNINNCTLTVFPNDSVNPNITCPNNKATCDSIVTYIVPIGSDNCGVVTTTQIDTTGLSSGSAFPVGTTTLIYQAVDEVGNTASCSFDVTIHPPVIIDLVSSVTIEEGDEITLDATITNAVSILWTPPYHVNAVTIEDPTVDPRTSTIYYVEAKSANNCKTRDSIFVFVNPIKELIINNFLSPNNDSKNDTWNINKPSIISGCHVAIYNRWEQLVWETDEYANNWDGKDMKGNMLPQGTYFYVISCVDEEYKGTVLLMR